MYVSQASASFRLQSNDELVAADKLTNKNLNSVNVNISVTQRFECKHIIHVVKCCNEKFFINPITELCLGHVMSRLVKKFYSLSVRIFINIISSHKEINKIG